MPKPSLAKQYLIMQIAADKNREICDLQDGPWAGNHYYRYRKLGFLLNPLYENSFINWSQITATLTAVMKVLKVWTLDESIRVGTGFVALSSKLQEWNVISFWTVKIVFLTVTWQILTTTVPHCLWKPVIPKYQCSHTDMTDVSAKCTDCTIT